MIQLVSVFDVLVQFQMLQTWQGSYLLVLSPLGLQGLASLF